MLVAKMERKFYKNLEVYIETWVDEENKFHRDNGPAYVEYSKDGSIRSETWYMHGQIHRNDGPADIIYNSEGKPYSHTWYNNGVIHRDEGPADIIYDSNGEIESALFYKNGRLINLQAK